MVNHLPVEAGQPFQALIDASGRRVWHERLVLRRTAKGHIIVTPDCGINALVSDIQDAVLTGVAGDIPGGLASVHALRYSFRPLDIVLDSP